MLAAQLSAALAIAVSYMSGYLKAIIAQSLELPQYYLCITLTTFISPFTQFSAVNTARIDVFGKTLIISYSGKRDRSQIPRCND